MLPSSLCFAINEGGLALHPGPMLVILHMCGDSSKYANIKWSVVQYCSKILHLDTGHRPLSISPVAGRCSHQCHSYDTSGTGIARVTRVPRRKSMQLLIGTTDRNGLIYHIKAATWHGIISPAAGIASINSTSDFWFVNLAHRYISEVCNISSEFCL
jgi:hypothetical protein